MTIDSTTMLGSERTYDAPDPKEVLGYSQRPYNVTPLAYFPDYAGFIEGHGHGHGNITDEMVGLSVADIANGALFRGHSDNLAVENLVVTHDGASNDGYVAALDEFVANGGNVVLTDTGVTLLGVMANDRVEAISPDDIVGIEMVSAGLSERMSDHPLLTDTRSIQRELWKAVSVGYQIGNAPVSVIDSAAFESAGGTVAGYSWTATARPLIIL